MPESNSNHAHAIGEKLRTVRKKQQMSLRELAHKAEISASMLSQVETGKAYPSVRSIYNIAAALEVPVDYFFPEQESSPTDSLEPGLGAPGIMTASDMREARIDPSPNSAAASLIPRTQPSSPIVHAGERPKIELKGGVSWTRLTAHAEPGALFLEIVYAPESTSGVNMSHHEGREFGLILEGELVVELGFEAYILHPGDSIIFDSTTPHRLANNSTQPARALWVVLG
jgi:transcriptional regulator with XRE-family HTH domain/quercetin dioxygenase-like cupin family protein